MQVLKVAFNKLILYGHFWHIDSFEWTLVRTYYLIPHQTSYLLLMKYYDNTLKNIQRYFKVWIDCIVI